MKSRLYLETTVASYLTAWPSRDLIRAAHQQITREWWEKRRGEFEIFTSQVVLEEAGAGDPVAAEERIAALAGIPLLDINARVTVLAARFVERGPIPGKAAVDAVHIAVSIVHGMDYLLTWNCAHIANATMRTTIESIARSEGYEPPVICTPEELLEE
jgi:hypothetical protein